MLTKSGAEAERKPPGARQQSQGSNNTTEAISSLSSLIQGPCWGGGGGGVDTRLSPASFAYLFSCQEAGRVKSSGGEEKGSAQQSPRAPIRSRRPRSRHCRPCPHAPNGSDAFLAAAAACRGPGVRQDLTQQMPGVGAAPALEADPLSLNNGGIKLRTWAGFLFVPLAALPSLQPRGRPTRAPQRCEEPLLPHGPQPARSVLHHS